MPLDGRPWLQDTTNTGDKRTQGPRAERTGSRLYVVEGGQGGTRPDDRTRRAASQDKGGSGVGAPGRIIPCLWPPPRGTRYDCDDSNGSASRRRGSMQCVAGQEKTRYQTRAPSRLPVATLLLLLLLLPLLVAPPSGSAIRRETETPRARDTRSLRRFPLSPACWRYIASPRLDQGPAGPLQLPRLAPTAAPGRPPGVSAAMEAAEEAHCRLPYLLANGCIPIAPLPGVPPHDGWRLALRDIRPTPSAKTGDAGRERSCGEDHKPRPLPSEDGSPGVALGRSGTRSISQREAWFCETF
jgi:hypothetical protein